MFKEITTGELDGNVFEMIDKQWFLLSAGDKESMNMMTCSWGAAGELWSKRVAIAFVRKTRYTFDFTEKGEYFAMSFFCDKRRDALALCGSKSGRDIDKVAASGLTPVYDAEHADVPYFEQAQTVFICKKLYADFIKPECFTVPGLCEKNYGAKDYHKFYVGEIVKVLQKKPL